MASKKREVAQFVGDGVFLAQLNELAKDGVEVRFNAMRNEINIRTGDNKVNNRGICAIQSLRYKLLGALAVRRACYLVLGLVMEAGAKGCEVIVSGKGGKSMKFKDGCMIPCGKEYIDSALGRVVLTQGVLDINIKIMLDSDPKGKQGSGHQEEEIPLRHL